MYSRNKIHSCSYSPEKVYSRAHWLKGHTTFNERLIKGLLESERRKLTLDHQVILFLMRQFAKPAALTENSGTTSYALQKKM